MKHLLPFLPEPSVLSVTVDRPIVRIILAAVIGLPTAAFLLFFGWLGIAIPFNSLREGLEPLFSAALLTVSTLGLLGVIGGWVRLLIKQTSMNKPVRCITVALLWCGVIAAICFEVAMFFGEIKPINLVIAATFTVLAVIGMLLIHATPCIK
ncbi:MAG: hypothetical protein Q7V02_03115 [Methylophilus sp.]|nr:hypothetical protein [Methylophilus sp.]